MITIFTAGNSIASGTPFCCSDLVHLSHSFFELIVLALLVGMSLILLQVRFKISHLEIMLCMYRAFPWQVKFLVSTTIERYEKVSAAVSVC